MPPPFARGMFGWNFSLLRDGAFGGLGFDLGLRGAGAWVRSGSAAGALSAPALGGAGAMADGDTPTAPVRAVSSRLATAATPSMSATTSKPTVSGVSRLMGDTSCAEMQL